MKSLSHLPLTKLFCISLFLSLVIMESCRKSSIEDKVLNSNSVLGNSSNSVKNKEDFAKVLAKAVAQEPDLRVFLKNKALMQFDLDYDILYQLIKNDIISNNETFRQKLIKYSENPKDFSNIESSQPLLTIYIPNLPSGFSAKTWNTETQIPAVSTASVVNNKVEYYRGNEPMVSEIVSKIPGFPLLVIKDNERVIVRKNDQKSIASISSSKQLSSDAFSYNFMDKSFDGTVTSSNSTNNSKNDSLKPSRSFFLNSRHNGVIDDDVITAYQYQQAYPNVSQWQRDYVYYHIYANQTTGPLLQNVQEHIMSLRFNDGPAGYNKISDQSGDPIAGANGQPSWSEGNYEFAVTVLINSTNGLGSTITKTFPVNAQDLFDVTYTQNGNYYTVNQITSKEASLSVPIAGWDLSNTSVGWKFIVSEVDDPQTVTTNYTQTSQFATNFGLEGGIFAKIGIKFGSSATTTNTQSYSLVTNVNSDQLGEAALYFYDPVITSYKPNRDGWRVGSTGTTYEINTGWVSMSIEPHAVY